MIDYRQARQIVLAQARSFGKEDVRLEEAFGRVLAGSVFADRDYPPFNRATMDGYAFRYTDLERGICRFVVVETIFAGARPAGSIRNGECYKIMTGAAVPGDADIVVRREDVKDGGGEPERGDGGEIELKVTGPEPWRSFLNIARQGEDLRAGDRVIDGPCRCEPAVMGLLATLGRTTATVACLPRVSLLTTGDEVVEPGAPVSPVQIRNSNRWMLEAALRKEGIGLAGCGHAADHPGLLKETLQGSLSADILILTGGVSAGDADHVPAVLQELGVRQLFHKIAMRPGKPTWCGVGPAGGMVFALPGNPFSCLVNFVLLIAPYIHACWGLSAAAPVGLPLGIARAGRTPLDEFFPARLEGSPARLMPVSLNGSGDIRLGMQANVLALHPAGSGDLPAGAEVACYSFV
jgi:molybdopterin molybdotransferase